MKKSMIGRIAAIALVAFTGVAVAVATFAWFVMPGGKTEKHIDGTIGLRSYFYAGNGSESDPFEIVTPNHFYNLCRLQNLGIFSTRKTHFQIGHDFGGTTGLSCINSYTGSNPNYDQFLDMDSLSHTNTILPIGSESAPFIGNFNGNYIPIRNLKVQGHPEDIGVFGYVSYEGKIEGLVCDNLEICSTGFSDDPNDHSNELFTKDIDSLFEENTQGFNTASLALITTGGSGEVSLRHLNDTNGTPLTVLDRYGNVTVNATTGTAISSMYSL